MVKRLLVCAVAILFVSTLAMARQEAAGNANAKDNPKTTAKAKSTAWHGWVTDTSCGAKGTNADHAACAKKCVDEKGAKYALYDTKDKKLYVLDPQADAAPHAGHHVTVKGTLEGDTIHVTSITMKTAKKKAAAKSTSGK